MDSRRLRFIVAGVALLVLATVVFAISFSSGSRQSTFSIPAGLHYQIPADLAPGARIEGGFRETAGRPVSFYIMTSSQYASYFAGTWAGSVFGVGEAISSTISYTTAARDTYYFVFVHGAGIHETQTVSLEWSFRIVNIPLVFIGIAFVVLATYDFYVASRPVATGPIPSASEGPPKEPSPPPP